MNMTGDLISEPSALDTFFTVLGVLVTGFAAGFTVVGVFVYNPPKEDEDEEEEELYEDKYQEEFEKLEEKELKEDFVKSLVNKHLTEETPDGEVIMCYNKEMDCYNYWCDNKGVSFMNLDAVAQKYAIDNDCKALCVNYKKEVKKAEEKLKERDEAKKLEAEDNKDNEKKEEEKEKKKSVFAKFKSYNTVNKETTAEGEEEDTSVQVESANKFRYKGKLSELKKTQGEKENIPVKERVSLTDWLRKNKSDKKDEETEKENIELKTIEKEETKKEK